MKVADAIKKLQAADPKAKVTIKIVAPKKKPKRSGPGVVGRLKEWANGRGKDGFTFLEAVRAYDRIGGSAGTSTVLHRLRQIGATNLSQLADSHLKARWCMISRQETATHLTDLIASDPGFRERYERARRDAVEAGGLAPGPYDQVAFRRSWGKKNTIWVVPNDDDGSRQIRVQVKPSREVLAR